MSIETTQIHAKQYSEGAFDRRRNLCDLPAGDPYDTYRRIGRSVAALFKDTYFTQNEDKSHLTFPDYKLRHYIESVEDAPEAEDLPFIDEPASATKGTAFLVGKRLIATAGHCISEDLSSIRVVFNYYMKDSQECHTDLSVYRIKRVVGESYNEISDWALLELEKDVEDDRKPLIIETDPSKAQEGQEIYMIGHPTCLPQKFTDGGEIITVVEGSEFQQIWHNLDAFAGNSGSPIFSADQHRVLGINVSTYQNPDYEKNDKGEMVVRKVTDEEIIAKGGRCENFQKMTPLIDIINVFNDDAEQKEIDNLINKAKGKYLPYMRDAARRLQHSQNTSVRECGRCSESSVDMSHSISNGCTIQ